MPSHDYQYFVEIAKQQSILAASDILFVSPSALSKYVQKLEKEMRAKLFERIGKRFVLTYAGERYLAWCHKLINMESECMKEMEQIASIGKVKLNIGFPAVRAAHFVTKIIPVFYEQFPHVDIMLFERNTDMFWPMFCQNELDVIFMYKTNIPSSIERIVVTEEEMVFCVSKSHSLAHSGEARPGFTYPWVDIRRFAEDGLIVLANSTQDVVGSGEALFAAHVPNPKISMRMMTFESVALTTAQGLGVSIMPDNAVRLMSAAEGICMFSFGAEPVRCSFVACYRDDLSDRQDIFALINIAKAAGARPDRKGE